ncbi:MAG: hypothetical protein KatS3mg098_547 [Candidatus Parcubacteria bacterium]|nr:hypothetical protein [Patescibacteria group bacterium]BCX16318.1 MAG: hypothetical protein KatS3mg098_547 [Candidatus Parcubacteria bacterium]
MKNKKEEQVRNQDTSNQASSTFEISWEIKKTGEEKSEWFYFILLGIMTLLLIFSIWQKNFLFGVFTILATGTLLFISNQKPETLSFKLTDQELTIGEDSIYNLDNFAAFDIYEFSPDDYEIFFAFKEKLKPILRVKIWKADKEKIEEFLKTKLPQKKMEPSFFDILGKILGI